MKQLKLLDLRLRDFKGVKQFTLSTAGKNVKVYGDNGTGKTTIFDAFIWLLFDKDSQNKKDFQIKSLDQDGNVLHGLEHEVEAVFLIDGKQLTLRKVYSEKWTKKRGSATQEFSGHTTDYYIDDVPVKKNEFTDRVDAIVKEDIFKLLTSPTYFNEQLHWQKRREILLQVCGDLTDEEVIESNKALADLPSILNGRSIEDHRKVIAAKRSEINKELEKIPVRIDEVRRSMPDISKLNESGLELEISVIKKSIDDKESELVRIQSGGEIAVKEKQLREIESELLHIKNQLQEGSLNKVNDKRRELSDLKAQYSELSREVSDAKWSIDSNNQKIAQLTTETDELRNKWHEVNNETFNHAHDENCPVCGQSLPEEQLNEAHEKALSAFNHSKAERLEQITTKGKAASAEVQKLNEANLELISNLEDLEAQLASKESEIKEAECELQELQSSVVDVQADPQYIAKKNEAQVIEQEIQQLRVSIQDSVNKIRDEIASKKLEAKTLEQDLAKFSLVKASEQRISDLKDHEKKLAAEFENLEAQLYLTEEFIRSKVSMLEQKINSKFKYARFKLFEQQINGGLNEVCETLFNGVPYSTGLNNAARINVGLDIIATLSEHYGFSAPIFVDNAEAVTKLIEMDTQVISLIVSERDKQLRIEQEAI